MKSFIALVVAAGTGCFAGTIVVPNTPQGNTSHDFASGIRVQQVYASSAFPAGAMTISSLAFRSALGQSSTSQNLTDFFMQMAVTLNNPDGLSTAYTNNLGSNLQTVYTGAITLSSGGCASLPCPFDMAIALQSPYVYNPASGNLVVDFRATGSFSTTFIDSQTTSGDSVSFIFGPQVNATGLASTEGLITQFTTGSQAGVPEPGAGVLSATGLILVLALRLRTRLLRRAMRRML